MLPGIRPLFRHGFVTSARVVLADLPLRECRSRNNSRVARSERSEGRGELEKNTPAGKNLQEQLMKRIASSLALVITTAANVFAEEAKKPLELPWVIQAAKSSVEH